MLVSFALGNAKVPNANGFALQWNIGLRNKSIKSGISDERREAYQGIERKSSIAKYAPAKCNLVRDIYLSFSRVIVRSYHYLVYLDETSRCDDECSSDGRLTAIRSLLVEGPGDRSIKYITAHK